MKDANVADMWNQRYSEKDFAYGKTANDFLVNKAKFIPKGKVLCLGAGEGRNAVSLAQMGYDVTAVDIAGAGLKKANQLAKQKSIRIQTIETDISDFVIKENFWQGIISIFFHVPSGLRQRIHSDVVNGLASNGILLLEGYSKQQLQFNSGGPPVSDLLYDLDEIKLELNGLQFMQAHQKVRKVIEGKYHTGEGSVIQILARKE
jgi:hypothetical protein